MLLVSEVDLMLSVSSFKFLCLFLGGMGIVVLRFLQLVERLIMSKKYIVFINISLQISLVEPLHTCGWG